MRRILAVVAASTVATATLVGLPVFTLPAPAATPVPVDVRALRACQMFCVRAVA